MKAETIELLAYGRKMLHDGRLILGTGLTDQVTRLAYMACFHAAQAIIFERQERLLKTHKGVHTEFHRVMKAEPGTDPELVTFLPRAYNFKAQTDYGFEADSQPPSAEEAISALEMATRFVDATEAIAAKSHPR